MTDFLDSLVVYAEEKIHEDVYVWSFSPLGALYCTLNIVGRAEGEDCVYLYSDIKSGIVGTWRDGLMFHGKPAILKNFTINSDYGLLQPEMEILEGREEYTFYESTNNTITPDKMLSDIYEEMNLFVAPSPMKDAGEGLFTKTQLKKGDLVAAYNGVKITFEEASESKELRTSRYIVGSWDSHLIDVPKVYRSTTNYVASLGHKANSANIGEPHNAVYGDCDHPRFGEITCVMATRDIQPYEEVLAFYGETYWSQPQECNL